MEANQPSPHLDKAELGEDAKGARVPKRSGAQGRQCRPRDFHRKPFQRCYECPRPVCACKMKDVKTRGT